MFARSDLRADLHDLSLEIRRIHFPLPDQFAVDVQRGRRRFRLVRTMPVEHESKVVLAIDREAMHDVGGMPCAQTRVVVVEEVLGNRRAIDCVVDPHRRRIVDHRRLQLLGAEDRGAHHTFDCIQILLEQHRRHRQRIADVVESISALVVGKVVGRPDVDAQQIAHRVVVLGAVEAAGRDASRIRLGRAILPSELAFKIVRNCLHFRRWRLRRTRRRHLARLQL